MTEKDDARSRNEVAIDGLSLADISNRLEQLARDLDHASKMLRVRPARQRQLDEMDAQGVDFSDLPDADSVAFVRERNQDFRHALLALGVFRREYSRWERLLTEHALVKENFTQRDAATMLGIGLSTVNRWAQHPLQVEDQE